MLALGVDPDLHSTSLALYDSDSHQVLMAAVASVDSALTQQEAVVATCGAIIWAMDSIRAAVVGRRLDRVVVEGQDVYIHHPARRSDILLLANVAGAAMAVCRQSFPAADILLPLPQRWKGQVPKDIHHARIAAKLGWEIKGGVPVVSPTPGGAPASRIPGKFRAGHWKHLFDAVGMAYWATTTKAPPLLSR